MIAQTPADMTIGDWLRVTADLQRDAFGRDVVAYAASDDEHELGDWWHLNITAAMCEVVEMGDELGWKPWTNPRGWANRTAAISEAADIMHFLGNILATLGCTGAEFTAAYLKKVQMNYDRQAKPEGDDVRQRRCDGCGRSLDDIGVGFGPFGHRCQGCGANVDHLYTEGS